MRKAALTSTAIICAICCGSALWFAASAEVIDQQAQEAASASPTTASSGVSVLSDNELARVGTPIEPRGRAEIKFGRVKPPTKIAPALVTSAEEGVLRLR
jgi:hypothetical protein